MNRPPLATRTPGEGGGGEVGADGAEGLGAGHRPHAAGDLDPQLAHPDDLLGFVIVERNPQVMDEPQVISVAGEHPGGQCVAFLLELAAAGGVQGDPGGGRVAEPSAVLFQDFGVDAAVPAGAGGVRCLLQFQQRIDRLPGPDHVVCGAGLNDRGQLTQQVSIAQSVPGGTVVAVIGRPGVVAGDPGEPRQHPGGVHPLGPPPGVCRDQHELAGRR